MRSLQAKGRRYPEWPSRPTPARDKESCIAGQLSIQRQLRKRNPKSENIAGRPTVYSQLLPSRSACNCLKTNDRCHAYPSRERRAHLPLPRHNHADGIDEFQIENRPEPAYAVHLSDSAAQSLDQSSGSDECVTHKQLSAF
jgi:hypothetical protein